MERIAFSKRSVPIPADYRPLYRIGQIALILKLNCRGSKASFLKLHLFHWGLKTEFSRNVLTELVGGGRSKSLVIWGFDPALNRALQFAVAEGVCHMHDGKYNLTEKGHRLAQLFLAESEIYTFEKAFLQTLGKGVSEGKIKALTHTWIKPDAEN